MSLKPFNKLNTEERDMHINLILALANGESYEFECTNPHAFRNHFSVIVKKSWEINTFTSRKSGNILKYWRL